MDNMDLLAPTVSELQSRIQELELRNVELEVRNVQLTKALASASVQSGNKIDVVNSFAHIIIAKHLEKISSITSIASSNEENDEVYAIIDKWSRCLCIEDFLYGVQDLNNGVRNRPTFSIEDFVVIFDVSTNSVDQKQLQRLARKFAASLTPARCMQFGMLRGDTRHSDVLSAFLGCVITLQLYVLFHAERPAYLYPMSARAWTRYSMENEYAQDVVALNNFDIPTADAGPGSSINLLDQRKKFKRN